MNQYQSLVNSYVDAKTNEYPQRQFLLTKLLGAGGEGGAFLANVNNWGNNPKQVALKLQKNMKQHEKVFIQNLIQYQNTFENGNNKDYLPSNIIKIYEYFEWQYNHCIIMELGSESLFDYISKNNNISMQQKEQICFQITQPIHFLHKQKLIHRDIKPENYIKVGGTFKLIGFGLVRGSASNDLKTQQVGTLIFQAPELIELRDYTEKVDIWALACVFYEVLSSNSLFNGSSINELRNQILRHKTDPLFVNQKINKLQTSDEIKNLIISMLNYNDQLRPSIEKVYNSFKDYLNTQAATTLSTIMNVTTPVATPGNQQTQQGVQKPNDKQNVLTQKVQQSVQNSLIDNRSITEIPKTNLKQEPGLKVPLNTQSYDTQQKDITDIKFNNLSEPQIIKIIEDKCQSILQKLQEAQKESHQKQQDAFKKEIDQIMLQIIEKDKTIQILSTQQQSLKQAQEQKQQQQPIQYNDQIKQLQEDFYLIVYETKNELQGKFQNLEQILEQQTQKLAIPTQKLFDNQKQQFNSQLKQLQDDYQNLVIQTKKELTQQQQIQTQQSYNSNIQIQKQIEEQKQYVNSYLQLLQDDYAKLLIQTKNELQEKFKKIEPQVTQQQQQTQQLYNETKQIQKQLEDLKLQFNSLLKQQQDSSNQLIQTKKELQERFKNIEVQVTLQQQAQQQNNQNIPAQKQFDNQIEQLQENYQQLVIQTKNELQERFKKLEQSITSEQIDTLNKLIEDLKQQNKDPTNESYKQIDDLEKQNQDLNKESKQQIYTLNKRIEELEKQNQAQTINSNKQIDTLNQFIKYLEKQIQVQTDETTHQANNTKNLIQVSYQQNKNYTNEQIDILLEQIENSLQQNSDQTNQSKRLIENLKKLIEQLKQENLDQIKNIQIQNQRIEVLLNSSNDYKSEINAQQIKINDLEKKLNGIF